MDKKKKAADEEDYGDYVTRCICDFKHDDGYMIACDECGVWQHVECMLVDSKNLPEDYLCEQCEPRQVDRRRARQIQVKKREALPDVDDSRERREAKPSGVGAFSAVALKKKRKKGKILEGKIELSKRIKKEPPAPSGGKKVKKRPLTKPQPRSRLNSSTGSIQSLLNAASLLDSGSGQGAGPQAKAKEMSRKFSGLWNANYSPWSDEYDSLDNNQPTEHVQRLLSSRLSELKSEAVVYSEQEYHKGRGTDQCSVCEVVRRRKGVVADVSIPEDELVTEYKGSVALMSEVLSELSVKSLWKADPCPFVYQYDKMDGLDICIDARRHGNMARFIRRSCSPNAEVRHFFVEDQLHFGVYALSDLSPQEEVTLAFDFQHDKCDYPVECACGQVKTACLVSMTTPSRARGGAKPADNDEQSSSTVRSRHSHVLVADEDSNSSWTSNSSHTRKKKGHSARATPLSPKMSRPTSREESSDSDTEHGKRRKSLTREERKTEQVWKMFEKMEASAQRKRQQLVSEGSADSADPVTSPLHVRQTPHSSRDRRTPNTGSRKAQLLHTGGKMRLSSVSSGDPLSPSCDLFEPFSPPVTPSLAHAPTPPHLSPSTPSQYIPSVDVTPYLHPKYLLEEFVLPMKKAFLRKWESQSSNQGEVPARYSYWAGCDHTPYAYHLSNGPRVKGSLKHRWLRQLANEGYHSDKENMELPPLPHKKKFLRKWEEANREPVPMATSVLSNQLTETEHNTEGVGSGRSSPLFDEFSDGEEFELPGRRRQRSKVKEMCPGSPRSTPSHTPPPHTPSSHCHTPPLVEPMDTTNDETKPDSGDHMASHDQVSDISDDDELQTGPKTPPTVQETTPTSPISPVTGPVTPLQESTPLQSPINAHHMTVSDISSEMDSSLGQSTSEPDIRPHPLTPPITADEQSTKIIEGGGPESVVAMVAEPSERPISEVPSEPAEMRVLEDVRTSLAPLSPGSARTPIKRKINLSEYRNRARKPAERKTSNESKPSTPPHPHTPPLHYPTLATPTPLSLTREPPQAITMTTLPTGIVMTTGIPPATLTTGIPHVAMVTGVGMPNAPLPGNMSHMAPQFEPVSPDDGDMTQGGQVLMGGTLINRDLPVTQPVLMAGDQPVVGMVPYNQPIHPQQQVWTVDDPRRASMVPMERPFLHEPCPPGMIGHPRYVIPQGMMGRGFPHPPGQYPGHNVHRHPPPPGSGYY